MAKRARIHDEEMAQILAFADRHNDRLAAQEYGVSTRILQKRREEIRAGQRPELAALFTAEVAQEAERRRIERQRRQDIFNATFDLYLKRLQELAPQAELDGARETVKMLGELRLAREALFDDQQPGSHSEGPPAEEAAGRAAGASRAGGSSAALN